MPGLYDLSSNANVTVTNTTGLYQGSGNVTILNSAQQLLTLLDNNGNVNFYLDPATGYRTIYSNFIGIIPSSYGNTDVAAYLPTYTGSLNNSNSIINLNANLGAFETYANTTFSTGGGSNYGNSNVAAYLPTDPTIIALQSNAASQQTQINTNTNSINVLNANVGAYENWANITFATQTALQTLNANVGAFETYANANAASQQTQINTNTSGLATLNANVGAFEIATNANLGTATTNITTLFSNAATQQTSINTINANLGAFETYANATFGTSSYGNSNVASYLASNISTPIGTTANVYAGNVILPSNGTFYGNLIAANIVVANIGIQAYTNYNSVGPPAYVAGAVWYDSVQDSLAYYNSVTNNEVHMGQELQFNVYNGTGSTINQGVPVYLTGGSVGTTPNIAPAIANTIATSQVAGVANQNISANTVGCVVTVGVVANVAMGSFSVGDTLYLSPYSAGQVQNTQPPTGFVVKVGTVLYNNSPNGRFLVNKTVPVNNQYFGNLTLTGNLTANNASITNKLTAASITTSGTETVGNLITTNGIFWSNGTAYSSYGNTQVAAYLPTDPTIIALQSNAASQQTQINTNTNSINVLNANVGAFETYANATFVTSGFNGNLAGNLLYDSTNYRILANAYPLSSPSQSIIGNYYSNYMDNVPTYVNGALQMPSNTSSPVNAAGTIHGMVLTSNIGLQSAYGVGGNKAISQTLFYTQVTPVTANSMNAADRVRGHSSIVDINLGGKSWGTMSSASADTSLIAGLSGLSQVLSNGNIAKQIGVLGVTYVTPSGGGFANVQYSDAVHGINVFSGSNGTNQQANVVYSRLFSGYIAAQSANLRVQNAVGLHTVSGWAGTIGTTTGADRAYAVLNEDSTSVIQTNGNVVITGNTSLKAYQETVYTNSSTGGAITINASNGTIQKLTLSSNITSLAFTGMPAGGSVTLILTQGGSGNNTLTTTGILYAGANNILSTTPGAIDMLNIFYDGSTYYASLVKGYA